jgi:ATP-dependent protease Clp ATPase subunit
MSDTTNTPTVDDRRCSCCGYGEKEHRYRHLIFAGPAVFICDECVGLCVQVLEEKQNKARPRREPGAST